MSRRWNDKIRGTDGKIMAWVASSQGSGGQGPKIDVTRARPNWTLDDVSRVALCRLPRSPRREREEESEQMPLLVSRSDLPQYRVKVLDR